MQLKPILPDLEYLVDQHLLLSVKGVDSCESYGTCGMVAGGNSLLAVWFCSWSLAEGTMNSPCSVLCLQVSAASQ